MHAFRAQAVVAAVTALQGSQTLALTAIGRHIGGEVADKHNIKRIDRLLGNPALSLERSHIYAGMAKLLVGTRKHPIILVDYSDFDAQRTQHILRAALAAEGRGIVVYEEVHASENCPLRIERFLDKLATTLPEGCQPVLVTDAGFRGTWRHKVSERGWFYIMRQRNRDLIRFPDTATWVPCKSLYAKAGRTPQYHGEIEIVRNAPSRTHAYTYSGASKGRSKKTVHGAAVRNAHDLKVAQQQREPWLLLSNLPVGSKTAAKVVKLYKTRMQIEEAFRDLKSHRFGFSFRGNRTGLPCRIEILLLLAALAMWLQWLVGVHAREAGLVRGMQANTIQTRNVLSVPTIGRTFLRRNRFPELAEMRLAISCLQDMLVIYA